MPTGLPDGHPLSATGDIDPGAGDNEWFGDKITRLDWMVEDLLFADGTLDQKKEYSMATSTDHPHPVPNDANTDQWWKTGTAAT